MFNSPPAKSIDKAILRSFHLVPLSQPPWLPSRPSVKVRTPKPKPNSFWNQLGTSLKGDLEKHNWELIKLISLSLQILLDILRRLKMCWIQILICMLKGSCLRLLSGSWTGPQCQLVLSIPVLAHVVSDWIANQRCMVWVSNSEQKIIGFSRHVSYKIQRGFSGIPNLHTSLSQPRLGTACNSRGESPCKSLQKIWLVIPRPGYAYPSDNQD